MFLGIALRMFLGIVWLTSGADKLWHPVDGVSLLRHLGLTRVGSAFVKVVGVIEVAIGATWVLVPVLSAVATIAVLVTYSLAMLRLIINHSTVRCACGGLLGSEPVSWRTLARNGLLAAVAALLGVTSRGPVHAAILSWIQAIAAGASFALLLAIVSQLGEVLSKGARHAH